MWGGGTTVRALGNAVTGLYRALLAAILYLFTFAWLRQIIELIRDLLSTGRRNKRVRDSRRGQPNRCPPECATVRPEVYKRADPLIYSQSYLMEQGLAVTWDNPDIQLFRNGNPVASSDLIQDTDYEVVATIWNNSTSAPAVDMPVEFIFFGFGIGTQGQAIGNDVVTLPVKGAPGHPTRASVNWHTPNTPGHYCLQARLHWSDDANPKNNIGQENTNVGIAASPAVFKFPVRNDSEVPRRFRLRADGYRIPRKIDCRDKPDKRDSDRKFPERNLTTVYVPPLELEADWTFARVRHGADQHPVPVGWTVAIEPAEVSLGAFATEDVVVTVTPPATFAGEEVINVNAFYGSDLVGGVTLRVVKA
jgi:hypothetical protein